MFSLQQQLEHSFIQACRRLVKVDTWPNESYNQHNHVSTALVWNTVMQTRNAMTTSIHKQRHIKLLSEPAMQKAAVSS